MNIVARRPQRGTGMRRKRYQKGAGLLGTLFKFGLPIVTSMLGGSGRKRRRRMLIRKIRIRKRNQKGQGFFDDVGKFFSNIF